MSRSDTRAIRMAGLPNSLRARGRVGFGSTVRLSQFVVGGGAARATRCTGLVIVVVRGFPPPVALGARARSSAVAFGVTLGALMKDVEGRSGFVPRLDLVWGAGSGALVTGTRLKEDAKPFCSRLFAEFGAQGIAFCFRFLGRLVRRMVVRVRAPWLSGARTSLQAGRRGGAGRLVAAGAA